MTTSPFETPIAGAPSEGDALEAHQLAVQAYHESLAPLYQPVLSSAWPRQASASLVPVGSLDIEQIPLWQAAVAALPEAPELRQRLAGELMKTGRQGEGLALYRQLLAAEPHDPQRLHNLASALILCGNAVEAEAIWRQTLELHPTWQPALLALAQLMANDGRHQEATALFQSIDRDSPEGFSSCLGLASLPAGALTAEGDRREATRLQLEALVEPAQINPARFQALVRQFVNAGQLNRALELLDLAPAHGQAWGWQLEALELLGLAGETERQLNQASSLLELYPTTPEVVIPIGVLLLSHDPQKAANLFTKIIEIEAKRADAWGNLALAFEAQKETTKAIDAHLHALCHGATLGPLHHNFGNLYIEFHALAEAQACFRTSILLNPFSPAAWLALGNVLHHQRHEGPDLATLRNLQTFAPGFVMGRLSLGLALLMYRQFDEAWPLYEARLELVGALWLPKGLDKWDGLSELDELLIVAEQGAGDVVQFMRYSLILGLGIPRITILAEPKFHSLLRHYGGFTDVHSVHEPYLVMDKAAWYPMASLLGLLGINNEAVIIEAPYLTVEPQSGARWASLLRPQPGNRLIGLNWQGNPESEASYFRGRSFPLDTYAPLVALPGFELVSLQKGPGSEQLAGCPFRSRFVDCQAEVDQAWDFVETLSILQACDLVITSDTSVAHLAGALGRPTWLLLKYMPDWRWGLEGSTTPWYPTMRLFRQEQANDWEPVIAEVRDALSQFLADQP